VLWFWVSKGSENKDSYGGVSVVSVDVFEMDCCNGGSGVANKDSYRGVSVLAIGIFESGD